MRVARCQEREGGPGVIARAAMLVLTMLVVGACSSAPSAPPPAPVAITDYKMVAGKWSGHVIGLAGPRSDGDWIDMVIGENGSYEFSIPRTIGVLAGKGMLTLQDGKLKVIGERGGQATFTLLERDGGRVLRGSGMLHTGTAVTGDLRPAR
jgi:hypothetical protein